jgi:hypothetical protein
LCAVEHGANLCGLCAVVNIICETTAYRPAIFTSVNDDSVGEQIDTSSGTPSYTDVNTFLDFLIPNWTTLSHCRFSYCSAPAILFPYQLSQFDIWDSQFISVDAVFSGESVNLHNVLISGNSSPADPAVYEYWGFIGENVTCDYVLPI